MKGDRIFVEGKHLRAARELMELLLPEITQSSGKFIMTIAGESGSGKSEVAEAFSGFLTKRDLKFVILQQDDYFVYPPKTNAEMRRKDINHVGLTEVCLGLLDQNLKDVIDGKDKIVKPLVIFDADRITEETVDLRDIKVVIVEGTYTTILKNARQHVFIDRTYIDTRESRQRRGREKQDVFLEEILEIEHGIISSQEVQADIVVTNDFEVSNGEPKRKE